MSSLVAEGWRKGRVYTRFYKGGITKPLAIDKALFRPLIFDEFFVRNQILVGI